MPTVTLQKNMLCNTANNLKDNLIDTNFLQENAFIYASFNCPQSFTLDAF